MPMIPSSYGRSSTYQEPYPSPGLSNGYSLSPTSSTSSLGSTLPLSPQRFYSPRLPPAVSSPRHVSRYTPVRRYTAGLDVPRERKPVMFQTRPLKSLTVLAGEGSNVRERSITRSPSPTPSTYSVRSNSSLRSTRSSSCCPRRVYPQSYDRGDSELLGDLENKEESPVVFDANLTFVLGCKGKLKQHVKPIPAHQEAETASNVLSNKISDFLSRTDHVMDEWKGLGHKEDEQHSLRMRRSQGKYPGRSRSATNIMIKGFQYFSRASSCSRSSVAKDATAEMAEELTADATECDEVQGV